MRAGNFIKQPTDYKAFIPKKLPPEPPIVYDDEMIQLLTDAERALGRLDAVAILLPGPDLFVSMYVKKEAVLSSQIEGTQSSLDDVLEYEVDQKEEGHPTDIGEVVNYVKAMNYGLERVKEIPVCVRLIKEIHAVLLSDVRGSEKDPGEFRRTQNWIGPAGCNLNRAIFVPPPVEDMKEAMSDLEKFLHQQQELPVLILCGLIHAQFETIHPFLDGNGRVGRLLITFLLCEREILHQPLLYLSYFLKQHRQEYYDRLMDVRLKGKWEEWLKFFLKGVVEVSLEATEKAKEIVNLREKHRQIISTTLNNPAKALQLHDALFKYPLCSTKTVSKILDCNYHTANQLIHQLVELDILRETTGKKRNRHFSYHEYRSLFDL